MAESKSPINVNPTPKQIFMGSPDNITRHHRLLENPDFQRALMAARDQYIRLLNLGAPKSMESPGYATGAAMCFSRIQGVIDFCDVLLRLAEPPRMPATAIETDNLDHKS